VLKKTAKERVTSLRMTKIKRGLHYFVLTAIVIFTICHWVISTANIYHWNKSVFRTLKRRSLLTLSLSAVCGCSLLYL